MQNKKSLFAAGVVKVKGDFHSHSSVILEDKEGKEVGRGLMNYGAAEMDQIKGKSSKEFAEILGYNSSSEIIFRQNLVLTE